jgi:hypothetical protein
MREIIKKSGDVKVMVSFAENALDINAMYVQREHLVQNVTLSPVAATLMIQALQEYLDGLSVSQPVDYVKPIAE